LAKEFELFVGHRTTKLFLRQMPPGMDVVNMKVIPEIETWIQQGEQRECVCTAVLTIEQALNFTALKRERSSGRTQRVRDLSVWERRVAFSDDIADWTKNIVRDPAEGLLQQH